MLWRITTASPVTGLTSREIEILGLIAKGHTTKEIAAMFGISAHTISDHRKDICMKLGIHSTAGLIAHAIGVLAEV